MPRSKFPQPMSGRKMAGILRKPIEVPKGLPLEIQIYDLPESAQRTIRNHVTTYVTEQKFERLVALANHYGVDLLGPDRFLRLVFCLAEDFVIGFRADDGTIKAGPGRKKGAHGIGSLFMQASMLQAQGHTQSAACHILAKRKGSEWDGKSPKALISMLDRFRRSVARSREENIYDEIYRMAEQERTKSSTSLKPRN